MLPTSRPSLGSEELSCLQRVLESGWLGHGATVVEFERRVQEFLGVRHVVAVSSGTAALHLALDVLGIGEGDEVIVPSLTFCGGVQAITALGAKPVFCEVSPGTLNVDAADIRARITSRTRAIMPVHFCGNACDLDELLALGRENDIHIVEDAAHAFGSEHRGRKIGSFGDLTCFSFDPIKNITCGEGGAVALADDRRAEEIRRKRLVGINHDGWQRQTRERSWHYEVTTQGYRYHMSNLSAAIGLAQFGKLDAFRAKKRALVEHYNSGLRGVAQLAPLAWNLAECFPFAYVARVLDGRRDELIAFLKTREIGAGVHYIPNHLHPFFGAGSPSLPVTEKLFREIITLPLYCDLQESDLTHIIASVGAFFAADGRMR